MDRVLRDSGSLFYTNVLCATNLSKQMEHLQFFLELFSFCPLLFSKNTDRKPFLTFFIAVPKVCARRSSEVKVILQPLDRKACELPISNKTSWVIFEEIVTGEGQKKNKKHYNQTLTVAPNNAVINRKRWWTIALNTQDFYPGVWGSRPAWNQASLLISLT